MATAIGSRAGIGTFIQVALQASTGDVIDTAITLTKAGGKREGEGERGKKERERREIGWGFKREGRK